MKGRVREIGLGRNNKEIYFYLLFKNLVEGLVIFLGIIFDLFF